MIDNSNGRRWARFTLLLALFISMAGNVTHTILAESEISLWLRVPPAALWPIFTFLGIEVLVRIIWQPTTTHKTARALVLFPAIPAAIVSYEHLYSLLLLMGEEKFIAAIGPAAIDGAMIGMTIVLLTTRNLPVLEPANEEPIAPAPLTMEEELERFTLADMLPQPADAPVSPAPMQAPPSQALLLPLPKIERAPRASSAEREEKVRALLADPDLKAGNDSTMRRYARVARMLRDAPQADIDHAKEKVQPAIVETIIRPWASLERVR
jgi:hypothetical protein